MMNIVAIDNIPNVANTRLHPSGLLSQNRRMMKNKVAMATIQAIDCNDWIANPESRHLVQTLSPFFFADNQCFFARVCAVLFCYLVV
mmetsp:Transcript_16875/g.31977  ORF Transcript_16875/g.31977 Transcript_16875/m.31977 type:complete len:87 (-) Transcript_16875:284-544(-)